MANTIGYISQGKLFTQRNGGPETQLESTFADQLKGRLKSIEERSAFKKNDNSNMFMGGMLPGMEGGSTDETFRYEFSCAAPGIKPDTFCYAIDASEVRGLFTYDPEEKYEHRIFHGPKQRFTAISIRTNDNVPMWLVAAAEDHGTSRIAVLEPGKNNGVEEVTEGDSLDTFPTWKPGEALRFAYQTCGVARNQHGNWMGLGPASIQQIDLETGDMEALADDANFDCLCPAYAPDGTLYYLRRPYEPFSKPSFFNLLKDIIFFPFRMLRAIFAFFDTFSRFFTGKSLNTMSAPKKKDGPDPKSVFLYGRWVNMEKEMQREETEAQTNLVPKNWQLVRKEPNGNTTVVQSGIMAFTVSADNEVLYSTGRGVYRLKDGSKPDKISDRKLVTQIFSA